MRNGVKILLIEGTTLNGKYSCLLVNISLFSMVLFYPYILSLYNISLYIRYSIVYNEVIFANSPLLVKLQNVGSMVGSWSLKAPRYFCHFSSQPSLIKPSRG